MLLTGLMKPTEVKVCLDYLVSTVNVDSMHFI